MKDETKRALKRLFTMVLALALISALFAGCGKTADEAPPGESGTTTPSAEDAGSQSEEPEPPDSPAPEARDPVPVDLLSDELNIFSDIAFPEGYAVYAAGYENNGLYKLYLTAAGDPEDIITYVSDLVGDSSEENIRQNLDYYNNDGGVGIGGRLADSGLEVDCYIAAAEEEYDYDPVEGCTVRLRAAVEDPSVYMKIIEDNYNLNALSEVAGYFNVADVTGKTGIYVRKLRNNVQIDAVYNTIDDVAGVMAAMKAGMDYKGFDENLNIMDLRDYGEVGTSIFFDLENNSISIFQSLADSGKSYKDFEVASTALTGLGFQNFIESDAMCEYRDTAGEVIITINVPRWGSRPDEWENSCVIFFREINGYSLIIWYYPDGQDYTIQADRDDTSSKLTYSEKTGEFIEEWSNLDTVKEQYVNMFADAAQDDVYMQCIELFKNYVNDTFGMSIDELYALAASE